MVFYAKMSIAPRSVGTKDPLALAKAFAQRITYSRSKTERKGIGQYFTSLEIAEYLASLCTVKGETVRILDPGAGTGILTCALVQELLRKNKPKTISITAYENDAYTIPSLKEVFECMQDALLRKRINASFEIRQEDFILDRGRLNADSESFDVVIMNPPYFKINKSDKLVEAFPEVCFGQPNIYSLFVALGLEVLADEGQLISITPRSFVSGKYFNAFRKWALQRSYPDRIHILKARDSAFKQDGVLQENIIIRWQKLPAHKNRMVAITASQDTCDTSESTGTLIRLGDLVDLRTESQMIHLPGDEYERRAVKHIRQYPHVLRSLGIAVNTGRVVAFRASKWLRDSQNSSEQMVPLYWLHHVDRENIRWENYNSTKPKWIVFTNESMPLMIPRGNYVLIRRFSSKDDRFRMIAAPLLAEDIDTDWIGVENHLNVISLPEAYSNRSTAQRISQYLNSDEVEFYMRALSGSTQIGAAELLSLPVPSNLLVRK